MKKLLILLTISLFTGFLCSCATIMRDTSQTIPITSNVEKIDIKIKNKAGLIVFQGQTPTTINLKSAVSSGYFNPEQYTITASKDGFNTETTIIDWHVSKWYILGNIIFGGLIGYLIVDPITGDMYYLDESVYLNMTPIQKII